MPEGVPKFSTPEEEIAYLRGQIAARERDLLSRNPEMDNADVETIAKHELREYGSFTPKAILEKEHQLSEAELVTSVSQVEISSNKAEEIMQIALEKGIYNALSVLEKFDNAHLTDDVHRRLIEHIKSGYRIQGLKEGVPPWHVLHMTLFEVTLPEFTDKDREQPSLSELMSMMTQFYAGMESVGYGKRQDHYTLEIAVSEASEDIVFYVSVPNSAVDLFSKQLLSLFPNAVLTEQKHDYNIFSENGVALAATAKLHKHPIYPIKTFDTFESDPLSVILNAFSKINRDGEGAAIQISIKNSGRKYHSVYERIVKRARDGEKISEAIARSTIGGELWYSIKEMVVGDKKSDDSGFKESSNDPATLELIEHKIDYPIADTNVRIAVAAPDQSRGEQIMAEIQATFNQFESTRGNRFEFKKYSGSGLKRVLKAFSFREFSKSHVIPLSFAELTTLLHFPGRGVSSSPQFKQSQAKTAAAPTDMPTSGTLLGINKHRGVEKEIYVTPEDRLRHFYIIGQTGTGKTTLMKNMIVQDIMAGDGVCMIDPHGTDIEDVLGAVPPEREQDVIYFDPSNLDRVVGLNMLEYDTSKPEQKTFVVNELFSIFQKLYGEANPESMGPMFEQYFRNSTLLVMEDQESGNTLMDISRVMADAKYRRMKLEKAKNPVVVQFWKEIATKAGGEASLENIVPYIVSKFDVFTANDYMRPIIGQQHSAFNFRQIMDERKILLVNLSKGRLGEINANLIGMIIVGKLLMAALSRVDDPSMQFPPFYLHMDEFQNISTPSISAILSEARKYKLGLNIAHQFIAQLSENIKDAVFGNVGSMAVFRVGPEDAEFLEHQFQPIFDAHDLMNIPNRNAYMRILANGIPTKPFSMATMAPQEPDPSRVARMIQSSAERYGRPREEIEREIADRYKKEEPPAAEAKPDPFAGFM